jgi:hypothetical protein
MEYNNYDVLFIHKTLNGNIICPEILELIGRLVPTFHTRSRKIFFKTFHSQAYSFNEPKSRMLRFCNTLQNFDFNFDKESKLRRLCLGFN